MVVTPHDVPADHAGLLLVAGMAGAVEREYRSAVNWASTRLNQDEFVGV
jgi:hypothetical protein